VIPERRLYPLLFTFVVQNLLFILSKNKLMAKTYNWGIIGLGKIAHKFAKDLQVLPNARIHAVASRSRERAEAFAQQYGAEHRYDSYEDIVNCPDLDVIYVATPHVSHYQNTVYCLRHGIPVLCEKPFAMNTREVEEMLAVARENNVFLMEAMWTRFMPTIEKSLELIDSGRIGEVLSVKADFGFRGDFNPKGRLYDQALGGGSLLDIGIYPVFLALLLLGRPAVIRAAAHLGDTGVDEEIGVLLQYPDGRLAHLHSSILARTKTEAFIYGSTGTIHIHTRWHEPSSMTLLREGERPEEFRFDYKGKGYYLEAQHVMDCLSRNLKESELLPLDFSLELIRLLDAIRHEAGIRYPGID